MEDQKEAIKAGPITKYKIVFLGDQSVGKTSIINRFIYDTFAGQEQPTVGIDFVSKTINLEDKTLRLQLWDTAGQERFRTLIPSYIRESNAAIVVYDTTNLQSFNNLNKWIEDVKEERGNDVIIYILGNKIDITDNKQVQTDAAEQKAKELQVRFAEVSAKSGANIPQFFHQLSNLLAGCEDVPLEKTDKNAQTKEPNTNKKTLSKEKLNQNQEKQTKTGKCC